MATLLYFLFLLSGAAALVYQIAWIRSLSLIFGGSHLAVTTVLAVFMGGLALGGRAFGGIADRTERPLRLYGWLELGIAGFALLFVGLVQVYPLLYVPLARVVDDRPLAMSAIRVAFAVVALLGPTTLMGGTLPVLSRLVVGWSADLGRHLSFLYGFNTLGAMIGSLAAGFFLLGRFGLQRTLGIAIATNVLLGLVAVLWPERRSRRAPEEPAPQATAPEIDPARLPSFPARAVLWGTAISGFCALGYEVLWTRVLSVVSGTSVYSVTTMLVAFLGGIALGSQTYGLARSFFGAAKGRHFRSLAAFGIVQVAIGLAALAATAAMRDLPAHSVRIQDFLVRTRANEFEARQSAGFAVAFAYMFVPAFLMGVAFPMASRLHAAVKRTVGRAVGEVLVWNTVGAIAGAAFSGYVLVYVVGVERALQVLSALNVGFGLWLAARATGRRAIHAAVAALAAAAIAALILFPEWGRVWDRKYFAVFSNNQREIFASTDFGRRFVANTELLYHAEGINETISVIRTVSGEQSILVDGRVEASTAPADVQCQRALGHVPMLLHPHPRKVFVLGLGTGMTLGAAAIHPEVEEITLGEIEAGVIAAARTFAAYNHDVFDNPKLRVAINDGRNFLLVTRETFDVITADPIQPWSSGAAYLFTDEYYRLLASRLRPGGIACQWLPLYEMAPVDVRTVVRTFARHFKHTMVWQTHYDAEVVGSNEPIVLDEKILAGRLADPAVRASLGSVALGTADDFLAHFLMGPRGVAAYGAGGVVNTDDNLFLEFSTPRSMGIPRLSGDNVEILARYREDLRDYLVPLTDPVEAAARDARWSANMAAAPIYDRAHALILRGETLGEEFPGLLAELDRDHPGYAPYRFLAAEHRREASREPVLLRSLALPVLPVSGPWRSLMLSAVTMRLQPTRAVLVFADPETREILGQFLFDGPEDELEARLQRTTDQAFDAIDADYRRLAAAAALAGHAAPSHDDVRAMVGAAVAAMGGS